MADRLEVRLHGEPVGLRIVSRRAAGTHRIRVGRRLRGSSHADGVIRICPADGTGGLRQATSSGDTPWRGGGESGSLSAGASSGTRPISTRCSGSSAARLPGAVTVADPDAAKGTEPRYEPISEGEIIRRLRRAASDGDLGSDDQSRSMLAGGGPKLLLARFGGRSVPAPRARALDSHSQTAAAGTARRARQGALRACARNGTRPVALPHELAGTGTRQYRVIEQVDRVVRGEAVTLIHQEDAAQALGLRLGR